MNIRNSLIKFTAETLINKQYYFSIKFIKNKVYEELFNKSEEIITAWFNELKFCCIYSKFRSYFKTVKVLGKGNFAKVFMV